MANNKSTKTQQDVKAKKTTSTTKDTKTQDTKKPSAKLSTSKETSTNKVAAKKPSASKSPAEKTKTSTKSSAKKEIKPAVDEKEVSKINDAAISAILNTDLNNNANSSANENLFTSNNTTLENQISVDNNTNNLNNLSNAQANTINTEKTLENTNKIKEQLDKSDDSKIKTKKNKKENKDAKIKDGDFIEETNSQKLAKYNKKIKLTKLFVAFCFFLYTWSLVLSVLYAIFASSTLINHFVPTFGKTATLKNSDQIKYAITEYFKGKELDKDKLNNSEYISFVVPEKYEVGDLVAFRTYDQGTEKDKNNKQFVTVDNVGVITEVLPYNNKADGIIKVDQYIAKDGKTVREMSINNLYGKYNKLLGPNSKIIGVLASPISFFLFIVISLAIPTVLYIVSYSKLKKLKSIRDLLEDEEYRAIDVTDVNIVNSENLKRDETEKNSNYFTTVVENNNDIYMKIEKYKDSMSKFESVGASDMDIIKINMYGNEEFNNILATKRDFTKKVQLVDVIKFLNTLPDINCTKKSGKINWTYKYRSKTFAIVKDEGNGKFKISFKLYPDAVEKLNTVFMAFEDSTFPTGPYWYMVNNIRNLPIEVIKWSLQESYKISKLQQLRADFIKEDQVLLDLIDSDKLLNAVQLKSAVTVFGKIAVCIQKEEVQPLTTALDKKTLPSINIKDFNKEIYFPMVNNDYSISVLLGKSSSEKLINAVSNEFNNLISANNNTKNIKINDLTNISFSEPIAQTSDTTKIIKKTENKKKK